MSMRACVLAICLGASISSTAFAYGPWRPGFYFGYYPAPVVAGPPVFAGPPVYAAPPPVYAPAPVVAYPPPGVFVGPPVRYYYPPRPGVSLWIR